MNIRHVQITNYIQYTEYNSFKLLPILEVKTNL